MVEESDSQPDTQYDASTAPTDAPIVAPITREVLKAFTNADVVTEQDRGDDQFICVVEDPDNLNSGAITVSHIDRDHDEIPTVEIASVPVVGSGIVMTVGGPETDWCLTQTTDDHNLLTEFVYEGDRALSIRGPPAEVDCSGIHADGERDHDALIPEEYRL